MLLYLLLALAAEPTPAELAKDPVLFLESARKALKWDEPAEPAHLAGPIYFVGTKGLSVFLLKGSAGHIVLNTGMPGSAELIVASIKKLGLKPEDVKILLCSHAHIDHCGGHAALAKLTGAKIHFIEQEKELFESGGKTDFHYGKQKEFYFEPVKVDRTFKDGDTIELGDLSLVALHTPGHTRGSTTFAMKIQVDGRSYSVTFAGSAGVNPGYRLRNDPSYPGIADDYRRTLRILEAAQPDIWLTNHNEAFGYSDKLTRAKAEGVKAWLDPEGYRKWVRGARERFEGAVK